MLGSYSLAVTFDLGFIFYDLHLVLRISSQWDTGHNVTIAGGILHYSGNCLSFCSHNGIRDSLTMRDQELRSYIRVERFQNTLPNSAEFTVRASTAALPIKQSAPVRPWSEIERLTDSVRNHTCGHPSFSNVHTLLQRN